MEGKARERKREREKVRTGEAGRREEKYSVRSGSRAREGRKRRGERWLESSWLPWMAKRGDGVDD